MALEGGKGSASFLGPSLPLGKTRYPLYRKLGGPQGWSGQVQKISPPPGFDPQIVQPVASRYTNYATRPTKPIKTRHKFARLQDNYRTLSVQKQNSHKAYLMKDKTNGFSCKQSTCFFLINNQSEESTRRKKGQKQ
jgi:hypothetical protein